MKEIEDKKRKISWDKDVKDNNGKGRRSNTRFSPHNKYPEKIKEMEEFEGMYDYILLQIERKLYNNLDDLEKNKLREKIKGFFRFEVKKICYADRSIDEQAYMKMLNKHYDKIFILSEHYLSKNDLNSLKDNFSKNLSQSQIAEIIKFDQYHLFIWFVMNCNISIIESMLELLPAKKDFLDAIYYDDAGIFNLFLKIQSIKVRANQYNYEECLGKMKLLIKYDIDYFVRKIEEIIKEDENLIFKKVTPEILQAFENAVGEILKERKTEKAKSHNNYNNEVTENISVNNNVGQSL